MCGFQEWAVVLPWLMSLEKNKENRICWRWANTDQVSWVYCSTNWNGSLAQVLYLEYTYTLLWWIYWPSCSEQLRSVVVTRKGGWKRQSSYRNLETIHLLYSFNTVRDKNNANPSKTWIPMRTPFSKKKNPRMSTINHPFSCSRWPYLHSSTERIGVVHSLRLQDSALDCLCLRSMKT